MICRNCGTDCPDGAMNCVTCGAPLYAPQQPVGQPYGYQQPVQNNKNPGIGLGVAGMVLGILSLILMCPACEVAIILSIIGLILSACGIGISKKAGKSNGMAVAGLVCSIIALAIIILLLAGVLTILGINSRFIF